MLVTYALTDLATVKALLGITDNTQDSLLELLINACTDYIERYCGRRFKAPASDVTEYYTGTGRPLLSTYNYPIITITSINERTGVNSFVTVPSSEYYHDANAGLIYLSNLTIKDPMGYKIVYKAGYTTIPNDLNQACAQMVVREYNQRAGSGDVQSESLGEYSVTYGDGGAGGVGSESDAFTDMTLSKYKRPFI